ncbi:MAG: hypothetical protein JO191_09965 [Mycobacteriaceae bacterium]|nr:hypothetical protein [Mycobacteriaceae bacterium]MBV9513042.1 hypothetical protein [Mycobacteriaceae bacterium]
MRIRFRYLMAAGAVGALLGAPAATADPTCTNTGGDTVCSTPGNVQINDSPSVGDFTLPYWDETFGGAYPGPYAVPFGEGSR